MGYFGSFDIDYIIFKYVESFTQKMLKTKFWKAIIESLKKIWEFFYN